VISGLPYEYQGDADQMLDALSECVATIRNYGVEVGMMLPIQVMLRNPMDHQQ